MSEILKDIRLNNMPANRALALDNNGVIKTTNVNINDVASATELHNTIQNVANLSNAFNITTDNLSNQINIVNNNLNNAQNDISNLYNVTTNTNLNVSNIVKNISNLDNRVTDLESATNLISSRLSNINGE